MWKFSIKIRHQGSHRLRWSEHPYPPRFHNGANYPDVSNKTNTQMQLMKGKTEKCARSIYLLGAFMSEYKPPPAPQILGPSGKSAWDKLTHKFEFHVGELEVLEQFCATKDRVAAMEAELAATGVMIKGSRGQQILNPLINQIAVQVTLMDRLVLSLALPADGEQVGKRRSPQARQAANARWTSQARKGRLPSVGA